MPLKGLPKVKKKIKQPGLLEQAGDVALGTLETPASLATGMLAWPISKAVGGATLVGSMLRGDTAEQTAKLVEDVEHSVGSFFTYRPRSLSGQASSELVGTGIEKALDIPLKVANVKGDLYKPIDLKNISEVDPRAAWAAGLATELATFKAAHRISKIPKDIHKKFKDKESRELWKLAAETDKIVQKQNIANAREERIARKFLEKQEASRTRMVSRKAPKELASQKVEIGKPARTTGVLTRKKVSNENLENVKRMVSVEQSKQKIEGTGKRERDTAQIKIDKGESKVQRLDEATPQETQQVASQQVVRDRREHPPDPGGAPLTMIERRRVRFRDRPDRRQDIETSKAIFEADQARRTAVPVEQARLDYAVEQARKRIPEIDKWMKNPEKSKVNIQEIKDEYDKIASQFSSDNPNHVEALIDPIERTLVAINRKQAEIRKPKEEKLVVDFTDMSDAEIKMHQALAGIEPDPVPVLKKSTQQPKTSLTVDEVKALFQEEIAKNNARKQRGAREKLVEERERQKMFEEFNSSRTESVEYDAELRNYGGRDMFDDFKMLFGDERGSFSTRDLSPERMAALQRISKKLKHEGKDIVAYLRSIGLDADAIAEITRSAKEVERIGTELKAIYQPYKNAKGDVIIKHRKDGPPVSEKAFNAVAEANELEYKLLGDISKAFENPIRTFERAGQGLKEEVYYPWREAVDNSVREYKQARTEINQIGKGLTNKQKKRIGAYAIGQQERGPEILSHMGVERIPELNARELKAYDQLRGRLDELFIRVNEMREKIGKKPIRRVENYFTFMRASNILENLGIKTNPVLTSKNFINSKYKQMGEMPVSFAKLRKKTGVMSVELDPFYLTDRYTRSAIEHINVSPVVAKVREMRRGFKDPETGQTWVLRQNKPQLDDFLRKWSNHIAGVEEHILPPLPRRVINKLQNNLVFSLLSFNARSALIQPTALKLAHTELGLFHLAKGISSLFSPKSRAHAIFKSKVLNARAMDVGIAEAQRRIKSGRIGDIERLIGDLGMKPLKWLDMETAKAVWNGAYQQAREKYKFKEREAINYADDVVVKTQASGLRGDVAPIQRTAAGRFLTLLQTFVINEWGYLTKDVLGIGDKKLTAAARLTKILRYTFATMLLNMLYEDVLGIKSPSPTPIKAVQRGIENDDNYTAIARDVIGELVEPIPMVGNTRYGKSVLGGGVELIADMSKILGGDERVSGSKTLETVLKARGTPGAGQALKSYRASKRKDKVQGLLPQELPQEAGELYRVVMGQYQEKKKKKKRKRLGY